MLFMRVEYAFCTASTIVIPFLRFIWQTSDIIGLEGILDRNGVDRIWMEWIGSIRCRLLELQ